VADSGGHSHSVRDLGETEWQSKKGVYSIEVKPATLKNLIQTLNLSDKETQNEIRDAAYPLSKRLAGQLMMSADGAPAPQTKLVAQTITAKRDRLIRVDIGGSKKVGRKYGGEASKSGKGAKVRQNAKLQRARSYGERSTEADAVRTHSVELIPIALRLRAISAATGSLQLLIITRR